MKIKGKQTVLTLFLLIFAFSLINCAGPTTPENNKEETAPPIVNPDEGEEEIPPIVNPDEGEEQTPSINPPEENKPVGEYKPEPENIIDTSIYKLNYQNIKCEQNLDYMYIMVRFLGKSSKNLWRIDMDSDPTNFNFAFPRGFALNYNGVEATTVLYFDKIDPTNAGSCGYTTETGFSDCNGSKLYTTFYYTDENMKTKINGNNTISFAFENFVIVDSSIDGELMGKLEFLRYNSSNQLTINIPMKDYNPEIHKNIAYLTVYFEPDKAQSASYIPYQVVLDGFEPK